LKKGDRLVERIFCKRVGSRKGKIKKRRKRAIFEGRALVKEGKTWRGRERFDISLPPSSSSWTSSFFGSVSFFSLLAKGNFGPLCILGKELRLNGRSDFEKF